MTSVDRAGATLTGFRFALPADPAVRLILLSAVVCGPLVVFALGNVGGLSELWDNLHRILSSGVAFGATLVGARSASGRVRAIRRALAAAFGLWLTANIIWGILALTGLQSIPSVADFLVVAVFVPAVFVLAKAVHGRLSDAEEVAVYFDSALLVILIGIILILIHGAAALAVPSLSGVVALAFPTAFIGLAAAGLVAFTAIRLPVVPRGGFAIIAGAAIIGIAYLGLIVPTVTGSVAGGVPGVLFTIGTLVAGFGAVTWRDETDDRFRYVRATRYMSRIIGPTAAAVTFVALLLNPPTATEGIVRIAAFATGTLFVIRQALLLRERTHTLDEVRSLHEENDRLVDELRAELVERARVQDRLIEASRMAAVGELAAGVAHEVNNPLTAVLGYSEILLEDLAADDPRRPDVLTIRTEALRARTIVRALRDFAEPRAPEMSLVDLPELITRTVDLVRHPLEQAGVVITESHEELPAVELDPQAIQQVVLNVLTNAKQAMPNGGTLRVESSMQEGEAVITITDDGEGMDETVAAQAFVPFFSDRRETGASGLGLSVSLGLVESHHGSIHLDSRPGLGTIVEIRLPLFPDRADSADPTARVDES
jgi:signal transduction histidine kinase